MSFNFAGNKVVITGAGGGVGQVMVRLFKDLGASVIACDQTAELLSGINADTVCHFDLADSKETQRAAQIICADGVPSIVISNAGWTRAETLQAINATTMAEELAVNLHGCVEFTQALLPAMRKEKCGNFVFVSSINAFAHFGNPAYSVAKSGVLAWMRAIAAEEGCLGIRANAVAPGSINTNAWNHRIEKDPHIIERVNKLYPLGRMVTPDEVAQAVAFLASDWSSGVTGVTLPVDAGLTNSNLPFIEELR